MNLKNRKIYLFSCLDDTLKTNHERQSSTLIAYIEDPENKTIHLFAAGNHITLPNKERAAIQNFCEHYHYSAETIKPLFEYDEFKGLFRELLKNGGLFASWLAENV